MATLLKLRRDTAANWTSTNPTPQQGEPCLETDTKKGKFGDGTTPWNSLPYSWIADVSTLALLASPAFTGNPTAPTPAKTDNSTRLATTGYARSIAGLIPVTPSGIAYTGGSASLSGGLVTLTGVSNIRLNGIFTSAAKKTGLALRLKASTQTVVRARLSASGTDDSSAHYNQQTRVENNTTSSPGQSLLQTNIAVGLVDTVDVGLGEVIVSNAQQSARTRFQSIMCSTLSTTGNYLYMTEGDFDLTTSFDGIDFIPDAGTITGEIYAWQWNEV